MSTTPGCGWPRCSRRSANRAAPRNSRAKAAALFERFNEAFWDDELGFYALALDGDKKKVLSVASNAGHCLWSGIVPSQRAAQVVKRLMAPDMCSGWGIRTLSAHHPAFNPYSYQTGSIWPHDNAIIALGFKRYGFGAEAARIARDISEAASHFLSYQLPELYTTIDRDDKGFPVQYLGANVPQAWAAGSVFALLNAILGHRARCAARQAQRRPRTARMAARRDRAQPQGRAGSMRYPLLARRRRDPVQGAARRSEGGRAARVLRPFKAARAGMRIVRCRRNRSTPETPPLQKVGRALDWVNFFLAALPMGFGPFVTSPAGLIVERLGLTAGLLSVTTVGLLAVRHRTGVHAGNETTEPHPRGSEYRAASVMEPRACHNHQQARPWLVRVHG